MKSLFPIEVSLGQFGLKDTGDYSSHTELQLWLTDQTMTLKRFPLHRANRHMKWNPRFMALLQPLPPSQSIGNKKQKSEPAKAQPQITKSDLIDALLTVNDALSQTWIVDSGASFHVTPIKECFSTFDAGKHGHVYLGNNHACSIEGIGTVHLSIDDTNELVLHDVRYVPGIKKSLLSVGQMDMHGYSILFERGSWKMTKGSRLIVKGTKKGTLYCMYGKAMLGKFIALAEINSHMELWHKRLGHMSQKGLSKLCTLNKLDAKGTKLDFYNECQYGKQQPIVGSNGQGSDLQAMQQVFPPPSVHPGYLGGGSVFQSMAGHAPGNQFYTPGTVFGGAQTMMPNPMYGGIGMLPGFQSTHGQFGMPQASFGMAGITNQQPYMTSPSQLNSGQGTQTNPNSVPMFQSLPYDNLTPLEKPTPYKEGGKGVTFTTFLQLIEVANTGNDLLKREDCEFNTGIKDGSAKKNSAKKYILNEVPRATQEPSKAWKGKATAEPAKGTANKWKKPFPPRKSGEQMQVLRTENKCLICEQPGHYATNCPLKKRPADSEDKEDRKGKRLMAGLVPDMVGDKPNSDASELCRA
ncbi:hypothetical protein L7F22_015264 [Adiantum nelumboides]|nr:hypothetical protein [Adiantum nelumboides]